MRIFAMSDMHGYIGPFEKALSLVDLESADTKLILLGDYIHGYDSYAVLDRVMDLEKGCGKDKVICLMGNHEEAVLEGYCSISEGDQAGSGSGKRPDLAYYFWLRSLRRYYKTAQQIFVHAGVDEEAGDLWEPGTPAHVFTGLYPPPTGAFYMDIIAGHTGTGRISGDPSFHEIFYDGQSHYYIDGSVDVSGRIPVLMTDTGTGKYYQADLSGRYREITGSPRGI